MNESKFKAFRSTAKALCILLKREKAKKKYSRVSNDLFFFIHKGIFVAMLFIYASNRIYRRFCSSYI